MRERRQVSGGDFRVTKPPDPPRYPGKPEKLTTSPQKARYQSRARKAMIDKGKERKALKALERARQDGIVV